MSADPWLYQRAMEREEERLEREYEAGTITLAEFNAELLALQRGYQAAAEQAAEDAYDEWFER